MADRVAILERARELDDDKPDDVCPACGQEIAGWAAWRSHYPGVESALVESTVSSRRALGIPWPFTNSSAKDPRVPGPDACPWDRDMLAARQHRRMLLRGER